MKRALFAIVMALLASCSVLPKREPVKIYELRPATTAAPATWPAVDWSMLVARPLSSQALDNERIAVRPPSGEVQVYKGAAWTDNMNDLLQTALIRRLEDSGKILGVARTGGGGRGQYQLVLDIRDFSAIYAGEGQAPEAIIEIRAKLLFTGTGDVIAAKSFRQANTAASEDIGAVVDAFSRSSQSIIDDISGWALDSGQVHAAKKP